MNNRNILGLKKPTAQEIMEQRDTQMHSQYFHPIENFPDRIDQLLESLNQVCLKKVLSTFIGFFLYISFRSIWIKRMK